MHKERLTRAYQKLKTLRHDPYSITKAMGNNALDHNIPPFLWLHRVFNMECPLPSFPPLLDTSEIAEQLTKDQVQQMEELNAMETIAS